MGVKEEKGFNLTEDDFDDFDEELTEEEEKEIIEEEEPEVKEEEPKEEEEETKEELEEEPKEEAAMYKPSFKYKVKGEEFDIDPFLQEVIKDKETEDKVIDILTRAKGLDEVSKSRDRIQSEKEEIAKVKEEYVGRYKPAEELYSKGHKLEAILSVFPAEDIVHAYELIAKYNEASEQDKRVLSENFRNNIEKSKYEMSNSQVESQRQKEIEEATDLRIDMALITDSDNKEVQEWYDSIYGKGSFKKEVYNHGNYVYNTERKAIPPKECVDFVRDKFKKLMMLHRKEAVVTQPVKTKERNQDTSRKDSIPNLKGSGSVVRKTAKPKDFKEAMSQIEEEFDEDVAFY